jgi:pyruvate,orthophosphate dikinase
MFFENEKYQGYARDDILSETVEGRKKALKKLLPYQKQDFYRYTEGYGRISSQHIRLLDPPLHEFVPHDLKGQDRDGKRNGCQCSEDTTACQQSERAQSDAGSSWLPSW